MATIPDFKRLYDAFNARELDALLDMMTPDVDWPNGWEGGRVVGREALREAVKAEGSQSWIYTERKGPMAGVPQETSYWSAPDAALDDPEEACAWGRWAVAAAVARAAEKPPKRRRAADLA